MSATSVAYHLVRHPLLRAADVLAVRCTTVVSVLRIAQHLLSSGSRPLLLLSLCGAALACAIDLAPCCHFPRPPFPTRSPLLLPFHVLLHCVDIASYLFFAAAVP